MFARDASAFRPSVWPRSRSYVSKGVPGSVSSARGLYARAWVGYECFLNHFECACVYVRVRERVRQERTITLKKKGQQKERSVRQDTTPMCATVRARLKTRTTFSKSEKKHDERQDTTRMPSPTIPLVAHIKLNGCMSGSSREMGKRKGRRDEIIPECADCPASTSGIIVSFLSFYNVDYLLPHPRKGRAGFYPSGDVNRLHSDVYA